MTLRVLACAVISLLLTGCDRPAPEPAAAESAKLPRATRPQVAAQQAFDLDLPPGFKIVERPRGPDFSVFDIVKGGTVYVGIYAGNVPQFDTEYPSAAVRTEPSGRKHAVATKDGREHIVAYLIDTHREFPNLLHVWVQDVPGDQETADRIAASVRAR